MKAAEILDSSSERNEIKELIDKGNIQKIEERLFSACQYGEKDVVQQIIAQDDCYIEAKDKYKQTPLMVSASYGNYEVTKLLLDAGAAFNEKDQFQRTALHCAVSAYDGIETVKLLLERGANIYAKDAFGIDEGNTPFTLAVRNIKIDVLKLFLAHDPSIINYQDDERKTTLLHIAIDKGYNEIAKFLLEQSDIEYDKESKYGDTPLCVAVEKNNIEMVELLLKKGVTTRPKNVSGSLLNKAIPYSSSLKETTKTIINLLLEKDPELVNLNVGYENLPIFTAVKRGNKDLIDFLIAKGADIKLIVNNQSAFTVACDSGNVEIVKYVYELVATHFTTKTLIDAVNSGKIEVLDFLLSKGANSRDEIESYNRNFWGKACAYTTALVNDDIKILELFLKHDPSLINYQDNKKNSALQIAINSKNIQVASYLIGQNINIDHQNKDNKTALHLAVQENMSEIVEQLIAKNCNLKLTDNVYGTALHYAAKLSKDEDSARIASLLLDKDPSLVNIPSDNGRNTAIFYAMENKNLPLIKLLISKGADVLKVKDNYNKNPLRVAIESGNTEIVKIFVEAGISITETANEARRWLIMEGKLDMFKYLVELDPGLIDVKGRFDEPLIFTAAESPNTEIIKYLISKRPDFLNLKKEYSNDTPIIEAAKSGNNNAVKTFIELGASIRQHAATLMHIAAKEGNIELIKILQANDIDINIKDADQKTPLDALVNQVIAKEKDNKKYGTDVKPAFIEAIQYLINEGADFDYNLKFQNPELNKLLDIAQNTDKALNYKANVDSNNINITRLNKLIATTSKIHPVDTEDFIESLNISAESKSELTKSLCSKDQPRMRNFYRHINYIDSALSSLKKQNEMNIPTALELFKDIIDPSKKEQFIDMLYRDMEIGDDIVQSFQEIFAGSRKEAKFNEFYNDYTNKDNKISYLMKANKKLQSDNKTLHKTIADSEVNSYKNENNRLRAENKSLTLEVENIKKRMQRMPRKDDPEYWQKLTSSPGQNSENELNRP